MRGIYQENHPSSEAERAWVESAALALSQFDPERAASLFHCYREAETIAETTEIAALLAVEPDQS